LGYIEPQILDIHQWFISTACREVQPKPPV
jgi:hypothetical protein